MRPGQKPLAGAIAVIAGLAAAHPDPTVNASAHMLNRCLSEMLRELLGEDQAEALFDAAVGEIAPELEKEFGLRVATTSMLRKQAAGMTDDLLTKLRKGGL